MAKDRSHNHETAPARRPRVVKKQAGRDAELALCKKKLDIVNIELKIYREIGGLIVKGSPRSTLLNRLVEFVLRAMKTGSGALYLSDNDTGGLAPEILKGPRAKGPKGAKAPDETALRAAHTGRPSLSAWAGARGHALAAPLVRKKKVIGVIEVYKKKGLKPFTAQDAKVLQSIANHFSIITERAELFTELDGRIKQFATLNEVGSLLISTLDQTVVRHRAMEAITRLMRAETGSLLLVDDNGRELYFEVALGKQGKRIKKIRLNMGEGIAGWVAKHGKPLIIPDVSKDLRFQKKVDKRSRFTTRNMVCVPVKIRGRVIGVLQAINSVGGPFTDEDLDLFQLFSNQAAIALDNARLYEEIREAFYATSGALAEAIEKRDPYTGGHTRRVLAYCLAIAGQLKLPDRSVEVLKLSAVLHDIGKIGIADGILRKNAPLTEEEAASMRLHPQLGAEILKHIPQLEEIVPGMLYHHERMDGFGYPRGFKAGQIPLVARIIAVADTYDAMTTTRPYRKGMPAGAAMKELKRHSGRQFDGRIVNAFLSAFRSGEVARFMISPDRALRPAAKNKREVL